MALMSAIGSAPSRIRPIEITVRNEELAFRLRSSGQLDDRQNAFLTRLQHARRQNQCRAVDRERHEQRCGP